MGAAALAYSIMTSGGNRLEEGRADGLQASDSPARSLLSEESGIRREVEESLDREPLPPTASDAADVVASDDLSETEPTPTPAVQELQDYLERIAAMPEGQKRTELAEARRQLSQLMDERHSAKQEAGDSEAISVEEIERLVRDQGEEAAERALSSSTRGGVFSTRTVAGPQGVLRTVLTKSDDPDLYLAHTIVNRLRD